MATCQQGAASTATRQRLHARGGACAESVACRAPAIRQAQCPHRSIQVKDSRSLLLISSAHVANTQMCRCCLGGLGASELYFHSFVFFQLLELLCAVCTPHIVCILTVYTPFIVRMLRLYTPHIIRILRVHTPHILRMLRVYTPLIVRILVGRIYAHTPHGALLSDGAHRSHTFPFVPPLQHATWPLLSPFVPPIMCPAVPFVRAWPPFPPCGSQSWRILAQAGVCRAEGGERDAAECARALEAVAGLRRSL